MISKISDITYLDFAKGTNYQQKHAPCMCVHYILVHWYVQFTIYYYLS